MMMNKEYVSIYVTREIIIKLAVVLTEIKTEITTMQLQN